MSAKGQNSVRRVDYEIAEIAAEDIVFDLGTLRRIVEAAEDLADSSVIHVSGVSKSASVVDYLVFDRMLIRGKPGSREP